MHLWTRATQLFKPPPRLLDATCYCAHILLKGMVTLRTTQDKQRWITATAVHGNGNNGQCSLNLCICWSLVPRENPCVLLRVHARVITSQLFTGAQDGCESIGKHKEVKGEDRATKREKISDSPQGPLLQVERAVGLLVIVCGYGVGIGSGHVRAALCHQYPCRRSSTNQCLSDISDLSDERRRVAT